MVIILTCKLLYLHLDALSWAWALSLFTHCSGSPRALHTGRHGRGERSGPSQGRQGTSWSPRLHGCLSPHVHWMEFSLFFISHHYIHLQCKPFVKLTAQNFLPKPFMQIVSILINNGLLVWMLRSFYVHACNILISYISGTLQHKKIKCVKIKSWTFLSIQNIQSLL